MNYSAKFDATLPADSKLPADGLGAHSHGHVHIESQVDDGGDGVVTAPFTVTITGINDTPGSVASFKEVVALPPQVIGHIQTAIGSGTFTRACGIAVQVKVGDPVCQGDVIETAADGRVGMRFTDGTTFNLSGGARMVLDEFVCDADGTSHSALFGVTRGSFAFNVGQVANTGCLRIDTPVGSIRGRARTGGIGMLSLTALIFSVMKEVEAAESHYPLLDFLDDDTIKPKDLELNGVVDILTRNGQHYTLDDPGQTIVISGSGAVSVVTNSPTRMAELQTFQQAALATYTQGNINPTSTGGGGGSSTPPSLLFSPQQRPQPINFIQPNDQPAPQNSPSATTQAAVVSPGVLESPAPSHPSPPPVLTLAVITLPIVGNGPIVGNSTVNTANTLNASVASSGFAITGTTSGVENGQTVTVTIVNGSNVPVETFTTAVANNAWSVNVSPTNAHALSDGSYTVTANVSNAAGTAAPPASQNLTVDLTTPTAAVTVSSSDVNLAANTALVTFTFSEAPTDFTLLKTSATGGTLSNLQLVDATHYTATFTAAAGTDISTGSVSVDSTWHEVNGNPGSSATSTAFVVDTVAPVITVPGAQALHVNEATAIAGVSISESDSNTSGETFTVTVTDTFGRLSANTSLTGGGGTITGSGTNHLTITGSLSQVTADLGTLSDTDSTVGSDTITVNATDSFGNSAATSTVAINVTEVLDAVNTVPAGPISATEDVGKAITGISISDPDATGNITTTLSVSHGTLTVLNHVSGGLTAGQITGTGTGTVVLTGTQAQINATLAAASGLVYREQGDHLTDTLTVATQDQGTSPLLTATSTVAINVAEPEDPAGVAGEPINLALTDPSGVGALTTMTISGMPADWNLNQGTNLGNGTWTVQTNDLSALTVTTAAAYTGAMMVSVTETWTNADGTAGIKIISDNVEAYAPGAPIFALSGNDTLTGAGGNDLFVFAQPIGNDTIYNFNTATDKIDLMSFAGIASFGDLAISAASNGDAVITLGAGETITLHGVNATSLTAADFVFNQTPVVENAGSMVVSDGAILPLGGTINNTGTIALNSTGDETDLQIIGDGVTLQGGGHLTLSDSHANVIFGATAATKLTNVNDTISGAGQIGIGDNTLTLVNDGTIVATGTNALIIDTGSNVVINAGTLEATGSGGLIVNSDVADSGLIWAYGGSITIMGAVTGSGSALISGAATLEFGAASSINVTFAGANFGTLVLDNPTTYTGHIFGFTGTSPQNSDLIDLQGIIFDAGTSWVYNDNAGLGTGGALSIFETANGVTTAVCSITFGNGDYTAANFILTTDGHGGTLIADPPAGSGTLGLSDFSAVAAHLADHGAGNAGLTLAADEPIPLHRVDAASLTASVIDLNSKGAEAGLQLIQTGATLHGGSQGELSDHDANVISGTSVSVTLNHEDNNEDNTISGAGQLGNGELRLANSGTINAPGTHALAIDTGSNFVSETLEASGRSGGLTVASAIVNSGVVHDDVSGNGTAIINGSGTVDFAAASSANVVFGAGAAGTLKLEDSFHFNGTISGFKGADAIDLTNVNSATAAIAYHENAQGTGGVLTVSDGTHAAQLSFLGHYSAGNFDIVPDHVHGALITMHHDLNV